VHELADFHQQIVVPIVPMKLEAPKRASRDRNRGDMLESLQQLAKLVIKLSIQSLGVSKSIDCGSQNLIVQNVMLQFIERAMCFGLLEEHPLDRLAEQHAATQTCYVLRYRHISSIQSASEQTPSAIDDDSGKKV